MWNYKTIKSNIERQGYYVFKNYLNKNDLKKIKSTLLETLNYTKWEDITYKYFS